MAESASSPVSISDRAQILDVLRGFALLGILLMNNIGFSGYSLLTPEMKQQIPTYKIDIWISATLTFLAEGKFYTIFSLLFGIGFSIILTRLQSRGMNAYAVFYRRLFILFLFGLAHILLLWEGDILVLYALLGMLLPFFTKLNNKTLLWLSAGLILIPILIDGSRLILDYRLGGGLENMAISVDKSTGIPIEDGYQRYLYEEGSGWTEFYNWLRSGYLWRYSNLLDSNRFPKVLGIFILGYYAGRHGLYKNLIQNQYLFKKVLFWGLLLGIPAGIGYAMLKMNPTNGANIDLLKTTLYASGVVPMALAYVSLLALHWIKTKGNSRLIIFAPVGRMALTNYIMQTMLGILIFYQVGLGWGGYIGPVVFVPITLAVYALQVIYSYYWLTYFNYGPLEWLWRVLTYRKIIPLRKKLNPYPGVASCVEQ